MFQALALRQLFYSLRWPINVSTQLSTLNYLLYFPTDTASQFLQKFTPFIPLQVIKFIILTINGKILYLLALKNGIFPIRGMFTQQIVILASFLKDFHLMDT